MNNNLEPDACRSITEIRREIDQLDHAVITLLAKRYQYVLAAAKFKTSETTVRAPERLQSMLQQRRIWAADNGLDADVIAKLFNDLVQHFIAKELLHWQGRATD